MRSRNSRRFYATGNDPSRFDGRRLDPVGDQLAQEENDTTSVIRTARLPAPSSAKTFAYPGSVATGVVPVGGKILQIIAAPTHPRLYPLLYPPTNFFGLI
jgi:hypothetical protein